MMRRNFGQHSRYGIAHSDEEDDTPITQVFEPDDDITPGLEEYWTDEPYQSAPGTVERAIEKGQRREAAIKKADEALEKAKQPKKKLSRSVSSSSGSSSSPTQDTDKDKTGGFMQHLSDYKYAYIGGGVVLIGFTGFLLTRGGDK